MLVWERCVSILGLMLVFADPAGFRRFREAAVGIRVLTRGRIRVDVENEDVEEGRGNS